MTPHSWREVPNEWSDKCVCRRCGLIVFFPKAWRARDWEDNGVSKDCREQMVRQVMES